jgi:hypothetical protein
MSKEKTTAASQEQIAGSQYILTFFAEIGKFTDTYCFYLNELVEIEAQYGKVDLEAMEENEKETVKDLLKNLRFYIVKTFLMYKTICNNQGKTPDPKLTALQAKLKKTFVYQIDELEEFVEGLNAFLTDTVIKELQETAGQIVSNIYGD